MARASYVYVVVPRGEACWPVAGFTVKHELYTWLRRNPGDYDCYRLSDGGHRETVRFTP